MEYGDTDEEDMSDLDKLHDSTGKRDSIDGITVAKVRPRTIPKKQGWIADCTRI